MTKESGSISIHTENILPIIKKWLYSDKDIFIRELVSNSNDAISKFKKLVAMGEAKTGENEKYIIKVIVDKDNRNIKVIDNGIGMTDEEVKKYINQIAFSGAQDFIEKYKDKANEESPIIGHFGLGFYSAFMVAERVQIDTLSYKEGAQPVRWISAGAAGYEMGESDRKERGTVVTLYVSEDGEEFLEEYKIRQILTKYCSFLPYEIYLENASKKEDKKEDKKEEPKPVNDIHPLWLKNPKECTDDEYKEFYRKVFMDFNDPLFWIHLNMEYPFNLKGILYFPKIKHEFELNEGQIKLYYNQVFVADNIKEVIPEFLMLLKGTIDCPDLPLNVSRSFLQNDGYVKKLAGHITKKVADKLTSLYENEKDNYYKYWDDINPFVKYGCMREEKFFDRVKDIVIYKTINGDYVTLKDYLERNKSKHENKVFYVSDEKQQAQYIKLFKENEMDAVILPSLIDNHFIQFLEMKESNVKFSRIDADLSDSLKNTDTGDSKDFKESLEKLFKKALGNDSLKVQVESLKAASVPAMILLSEQSRRMQEMSRMFGGGADMSHMFPREETLILNKGNSLIQAVEMLNKQEDKKEDAELICKHIYDLAIMSNRQLDTEEMARFVERSNLILGKLAGISNGAC
jgi:molecular chaperone HtpG